MSLPPPLPPAAASPPPPPDPPPPVRAESAWEFHADERILETAFGHDGRVRVVDALGTFTMLDAQGRSALSSPHGIALRGAALMPSGAAALLTEDDRLLRLDEQGRLRFEMPVPGATAVGASSRMIVTGGERHPVRSLSLSGKLRATCDVQHPVAFIAPASSQGHVVALSPSGQFSVVLGEHLLWRLHLRSNATALAASDAGIFVVAHREGAQAFTIEGTCLGLFDVGRPLKGVAVAADAPILMLLDDEDRLHLVDLSTGYSTWREHRSRAQSMVRLSRDGSRGLSVSRAGGVELLAFVRAADRAERLEVVGRPGCGGDAIWRHVTGVIEDVEPSCRFAVDPAGATLAVSRDQGSRIELHDASGTVIAKVMGMRDLAALAFSADGTRLLLHGHRSVTSFGRDGRDRMEIAGEYSHVVPGTGSAILLVTASPACVRVHAGRDVTGECALPSPVVHALAAPDFAQVAIADAAGSLTCWAAGHSPWRRPHVARAGSLAIGGPGFVACEGEEIVGLTPYGTEAWRVQATSRLELFTLGGRVYARESANRFFRVGEGGEMQPVDAKPNLGRSLFMTNGGALVELNVNGRVLTAFTAEGGIAWRCEAPGAISTADLIARDGLLAFRAGTRLCLLALHGPTPRADVAGRAAFLEL